MFDSGVAPVSMPAAGPSSAGSIRVKLSLGGHLTVALALRSIMTKSCAGEVRLWFFLFQTRI